MSEKSLQERFMAKVKVTDECWLWTGAKCKKGYGRFSVGRSKRSDGTRRNSMVAAHRQSYQLFVGQIPEGSGFHGTCVLHKCDIPACVNPSHLFLGTNEDNVHDMDRKGRRINKQHKGSKHACAILDETKALEIFRLAQSRAAPQLTIAKKFGVCLSTVNHINTGRLWAHVTGIVRCTK